VTTRRQPVEPFELTAEEKQTLERWSRGRTVSQALVRRARIVLGCAQAARAREVAREPEDFLTPWSKWRQRFGDRRLDGMADTPHPNVHRKLADDRVEELVRADAAGAAQGRDALEHPQARERVGVTSPRYARVARLHLKPHRRRTFTLSNDVFFVEKSATSSACTQPPDHAVVLCLDEKSQIQAWSGASRSCR